MVSDHCSLFLFQAANTANAPRLRLGKDCRWFSSIQGQRTTPDRFGLPIIDLRTCFRCHGGALCRERRPLFLSTFRLQNRSRVTASSRQGGTKHELEETTHVLCKHPPQAYAPVGRAAEGIRNKRHSKASGVSDHSAS